MSARDAVEKGFATGVRRLFCAAAILSRPCLLRVKPGIRRQEPSVSFRQLRTLADSASTSISWRRMRKATAGRPFRSEPSFGPAERHLRPGNFSRRGAARRPFFSPPHRAVPSACVPSQACSLFSHVLAIPYYQSCMRMWPIIRKTGNNREQGTASRR